MNVLRHLGLAIGVPLGLLACAAPPPAPPTEVEPTVELRIDAPAPGSFISSSRADVVVRGSVRPESTGAARPVDAIVLVDVSNTTRYPSGRDVDGDGEVGFDARAILGAHLEGRLDLICTDPEDSILQAQLAAVHKLLDHVDPRRVRLGLIPFVGRLAEAADARQSVRAAPLTRDMSRVRSDALQIAPDTPGVIVGAALNWAVEQLRRDDDRDRLILVLSATPAEQALGLGAVPPTLDRAPGPGAVRAAGRARKAGIEVVLFGVGPSSLSPPLGAAKLAHLTEGEYRPLSEPQEIVTFATGDALESVSDLHVSNLDTGAVASDVLLAPDGSFSARVPVVPGSNRFLVSPTTNARVAGRAETHIEFDMEEQTLWELLVDLEEARKTNRDLILLIEAERIRRGGEGEVAVELGE